MKFGVNFSRECKNFLLYYYFYVRIGSSEEIKGEGDCRRWCIYVFKKVLNRFIV